jgi:predicted permease
MLSDLKYAFRQLSKNRGFTCFAVLTLALGIGANTAIFSVINAVLLTALPVKAPQQLVFLTDPKMSGDVVNVRAGSRDLIGYAEYENLRDHNSVFSGMLAVDSGSLSLDAVISNPGQRAAHGSATISSVSGNYFSVLGVGAILGRTFTEEVDKVRDANPVAVVSYNFWQDRLGADLGVLGRKVLIEGIEYDVIGVAPRSFLGESVGRPIDLWVPLSMQDEIRPGLHFLSANADPAHDYRWLQVIGRLKPAVNYTQAKADIDVVFRQFLSSELSAVDQGNKKQFLEQRIALSPAGDGRVFMRSNTEPLLILMVLVALLLLSACANLAHLSLARATRRQKEIAVRLAIGAKPARIFRQLLTESLLLAVVGGAMGLLFAQWGESLLLQIMAQHLDVHLNVRILAFAFAASLFVGIIFGVGAALQAARVDLNGVLKGTGEGTARVGSVSIGKALAITQVALSLPLLITAGLFVHSFQKLTIVDLGYDSNHLLMFRADTTGHTGPAVGQFYQDLSNRIRVIPGVRSVTLSQNGLFGGGTVAVSIAITGYAPTPEKNMGPAFDQVGSGYFSTVGITILSGREIAPEDAGSGQRVGVINQTMARYYFGDSNPLGRQITVNWPTSPGITTPAPFVVVGVAADTKIISVRGAARPFYYVPYYNPVFPPFGTTGIIRTTGDPAALIAAVRAAVKEIAPNSLPPTIMTVNQAIDRTLGLDRLLTEFSGFFGGLATLLVSIGIYGILSYSTVQRTREIGIRIALGAQRGNVLRLVMGESLGLVLIGVIIGIPIAIGGGKFVAGYLFGLTPEDPLVLAAASGLMIAVAGLASFLPSFRATQVDPNVALRVE